MLSEGGAMAKAKHEYHEGAVARENFEKLASELFQAPKSAVTLPKQTRQTKKSAFKKRSGKDKV
jgi:hypothetical protein